MAYYRVRNNLKSNLRIPTQRRGMIRVRPRQTITLNVASVNSPHMRALQQSAAVTMAPAANPLTGRVAPKLPKVHKGLVRQYAALPGSDTTPMITGM